MADVKMQMVVAVVRNEKKRGDVQKDIHGYEQKYLFCGDMQP